MGKERLNYLSLISVANQLMHEINTKQIILIGNPEVLCKNKAEVR